MQPSGGHLVPSAPSPHALLLPTIYRGNCAVVPSPHTVLLFRLFRVPLSAPSLPFVSCAARSAPRHLPLARDLVRVARQRLVFRLDAYCKRDNKLFSEVIR